MWPTIKLAPRRPLPHARGRHRTEDADSRASVLLQPPQTWAPPIALRGACRPRALTLSLPMHRNSHIGTSAACSYSAPTARGGGRCVGAISPASAGSRPRQRHHSWIGRARGPSWYDTRFRWHPDPLAGPMALATVWPTCASPPQLQHAMGSTLLSVMPKRGSQNTTDGTVPSAEVTSANHVAPLCAFHVCGLCAADRANGDPETERGARTSNQVSDVVPRPPLPEDATANVGRLHRRSARTQQRRVPLRASPIAAQRATALP